MADPITTADPAPAESQTLTREDIRKMMGLPSEQPAQPAATDQTNAPDGTNFPKIIDPRQGSLAPRTDAAMDQQIDPGQRGFLGAQLGHRRALEEYRQTHQEAGTPLDVEGGLPPWERLMEQGRMNERNKLAYLAKRYGPDKVRMTADGDIFARIPDSEHPGKEKDVPITRTEKLTASDIIDLSIYMPETFGYMAMERLAMKAVPSLAKRGALRASARIAAGSIGAEVAGAPKDIMADWYDFGKIAFPDIAAKRGEQAAADFAIGSLLGFGRFLRNPFAGNFGDIQFDRIAAGEYMQRKFGINPIQTAGEATGSPLFLRSEAFVEKEPGGSGPIRAVKAKQEQQLRNLQDLMMGPRRPLDEEVGAEAIRKIQEQVEIHNMGVDVAKRGVARSAESTIQGLVAGLTTADRNLYRDAVGKEIRDVVISKRNAAKAEADRLFEEVSKQPGGTGKVFSADPLKREYQRIRDSVASAEGSTVIPITILGPESEPLTTTQGTTTPMQGHIPPNIMPRLNEVINLPEGSKFSLADLQKMRRDVYDDIARGEGVPGPPSHYLSEIGKAITTAIDESISKIPSEVNPSDMVNYNRLQQALRDASREGRDIGPIWQRMEDIKNKYMGFTPAEFKPGALRDALKAANEFYKKDVVPFSRRGITEMFRAPTDPGFIPDERIINQLFKGDTPFYNWDVVKETVGADSPTFARIKRVVADNLIPFEVGSLTIDADAMIKNMDAFKRKNPKIFADIFSDKEQELFRQASALKYAKTDKVDAAQLQALLASNHPTGQILKLLVDANRLKTDIFRNEIVKAIGDGIIDETKLRPVQFVNRLLEDTRFSVKETEQLMGLLKGNPELEQDLRQKTFEKLFRDAARPPTSADISRTARGDETHILSGGKLNDALKDKTYKNKVAAVLGPEAFEDLNNFIKILAPLEQKEEAYALAGGLAAGSRVGQLERALEGKGGLLRFAGNTTRSFVFSTLLSNSLMRNWMGNIANPYDQKTLIMSFLTSPPFLKAVAKEYPGTAASRLVNEISTSVKRAVQIEMAERLNEHKPKTAQEMGMAAKPMTREDIGKFMGFPTKEPIELLPAVRLMGGRIIQATPQDRTHNDIIARNKLKAEDIDQRGFIDQAGVFLDREAAALKTGFDTNTEPGRLHSTDLPRAK